MSMNGFTKIGDASRLLLEKGFSPETVSEALGMVGDAIGVDRVYIFENVTLEDGQLGVSQRYEWAAGSAAPQLDNPELQNVPFEMVAPGWTETLQNGDVVIGLTSELSSPTKELLESQDILSLLICPIMLGGKLWGFVGFDDCRTPRQWPAIEVTLLRTLARALAGSLRHSQVRGSLRDVRSNLLQVIEGAEAAIRRA